MEDAGHTRATGAPKLSYRQTSPQLATGKAASRGKSGAIARPGGPSLILFSGTPNWEVASAADLRLGARFVLGRARTLRAALRDAVQTIDRVHSNFHDLPERTHWPRCGSEPGRPIGQGPTQSNGMCLAEFSVYSNLKPCASTDRIVDFPQVASCGPGPVSLPGAFIS